MGGRVERERRIALLLPVHFEWLGNRVTGLAGNVSRRGIYVRTDEQVPIGEIAELGIALPNSRLVHIVARAAHRLEAGTATSLGRFAGVGFEFLERRTSAVRALAETIDQVAGEVSAPIDSAQQIRVLVADADPRLLDRMTTILDDAGCIVKTASNGLEAFSACTESRPDLILCAECMPIMDGEALQAQLDEDGMDVPVRFIRKPFTDVELCSQVASAVDEQRSRPRRPSLKVNLREMSLGALLSFLEGARKTGIVTAQRHGLAVELRLREGRIVDASAGTALSGRKCVLDLLDWIEGVFEFHAGPVDDEDQIGCSISRLLLDHAQLQDDLMEAQTAVRQAMF